MCFSHRNVTVEEGERVKLTLSTSRRLSSPVSVRLIYTDGTTVSSGELWVNLNLFVVANCKYTVLFEASCANVCTECIIVNH